MEGKIKTALEMAMERMKSFKEVDPEEIEKLEYIPRGKALGAAFLRDMNADLESALADYDENRRKHILEGFEEALLANLALPVNDENIEGNRRSFEGIIGIKSNKREITALLNELEYLFNQYQQALEQAKENLRQEMAMNARMGRHRQGGHPGAGYEAERQMGYREEWARLQSQLTQRYEAALADAKNKIKSIQ